jgi:hypothetical protein
MRPTFYETLLVPRGADAEVVRAAWEQAQVRVSRQLKAAVERGEDTVRLEEERAALDEAWAVLSDPARRVRYDRFLDLGDPSSARTADELWAQVSASTLDPVARASLDLVRALTDLPVTDDRRPVAPPPPVPPPPESPSPLVAPVEAAPAGPATPRLRVQRATPAPGPRPRIAVVTAQETADTDPGSPAPEAATDLPTLLRQHGWSGALIARIREIRGVGLAQIAATTHISERYLAAIEADDFGHLPAQTFVRGYLEQVARILGLDEASLVEGYIARMTRGRD